MKSKHEAYYRLQPSARTSTRPTTRPRFGAQVIIKIWPTPPDYSRVA
jgi:hypothetical protein